MGFNQAKSLPQINDRNQHARQKGGWASLDEILSDPLWKIQSKQNLFKWSKTVNPDISCWQPEFLRSWVMPSCLSMIEPVLSALSQEAFSRHQSRVGSAELPASLGSPKQWTQLCTQCESGMGFTLISKRTLPVPISCKKPLHCKALISHFPIANTPWKF